MTWPGIFHVVLMTGALCAGAVLFATAKGTLRHRLVGRTFVGAVLLSNVVVFSIYEDSATMGVFHVLAVVSFVSVLAGLLLARFRTGGRRARIVHGHVMLWSFGGLVAAGLGQGATALGLPPWPVILAVLFACIVPAVRLDFRAMLSAG